MHPLTQTKHNQTHTQTQTKTMDYKTMIQTRPLTAKFCAEVILNDYIPKSESDKKINEHFILTHQTHLTMEDLDQAWENYSVKQREWLQIYMAKTLTIDEKMELLMRNHGSILKDLSPEAQRKMLHRTIRTMTWMDWYKMLQKNAF